MIGIQEMVAKTEQQRREVETLLDTGHFHPDEASILQGQKSEDLMQLRESLRVIPLREFLAKSGTTGISGAAYLIADKIHVDLMGYAQETDRVPQMGYVVNGWEGGDLKVNIAKSSSATATTSGPLLTDVPDVISSASQAPSETVEYVQATVSPVTFGVNIRVTNDLIDDSAYDLISWHLKNAAIGIGKKASSMAVAVLIAAPDGAGTLNTQTADAGEIKWKGSATKDIYAAVSMNLNDGWTSDTVLTGHETWAHSIGGGTLGGQIFMPAKPGFDNCIDNLDIILHWNVADLYNGSKHRALVFDRKNALLTGRKRWMRIENYSDPIKDLAGAWVSCRQDSVTLHKDAICLITEA